MSRFAYERLSAIDNTFLQLETPNAYMHVVWVEVYDSGPLRTEDGGVDFERIVKGVGTALSRTPRLRQRLAWIPIENHPVWVDDDCFDIRSHLKHTSLPRPGNERQLKELAATLAVQQLDRSRPLWEACVVEGLEGGRFAIVRKLHHCISDGLAAVELSQMLGIDDPEVVLADGTDYPAHRPPTALQLTLGELRRRGLRTVEVLRALPEQLPETRRLRRELLRRARALGGMAGMALQPVVDAPFNGPIGPRRRFEWIVLSRDDLKSVRRRLGGTANDLLLAIVAGALRRYLERHRVDPAVVMRAMVPVSLRSGSEAGELGNRISAWFVDLPVGEPDPRRRLEILADTTKAMRKSNAADAFETMTRVLQFAPPVLTSAALRNVMRLRPFNLIITNLPGPPPTSLLGAPVVSAHATIALADGLGLGVAALTYRRELSIGLTADYDLVPDVDALAEATRASFRELEQAAAVEVR